VKTKLLAFRRGRRIRADRLAAPAQGAIGQRSPSLRYALTGPACPPNGKQTLLGMQNLGRGINAKGGLRLRPG